MNIAFIVPQGITGSTYVGRVLPLAQELAPNHQVHILHLNHAKKIPHISHHSIGSEPFTRDDSGKKRLKGFALVANMLTTAIRTAHSIYKIKPEVIIVHKTLPHTVLGVRLATLISNKKIILDIDDFELTANSLTSIWQRAPIHWAERTGIKMAQHIVTASPFLTDHVKQLRGEKKVTMIPTGIDARIPTPSQHTGPRLLYIGSVSISSGHRVDLLPKILSEIHQAYPKITLTLAGSGDDVKMLQQMCKKLNLEGKVIWRGRFTAEHVHELLSVESVLIDPIDGSVSNRAKSSYRTALAGITGTPIVTSNIGIRPYFLPQELHERFFAKPADTGDYAAKICALIANPITPSQREGMRQHMQPYTWQRLASEYQKHILA